MSNPLQQRLENDFKFHPADEDTGARHQLIRETHLALAEIIREHCPVGREQSLALTKLEESMFWANAAIARAAGN